ncbi:triphosphoribosyl-dephospho-CoA synthase [Burkholderia contaminans FFH2055]|uniref:triphosphoribosyl-dephospho-CoA synthase MdcB n=1 Tax=Burkholderia contaminans TaxID=488447 RepID=UPI0006269A1E|nr:triphosphoribosyl-dephospho-CoA synthase MdcB [Burkholderia contaminans]KKL38321.1 triphosphoribosyl-dephospho-CoA synthase [Burkholderia contaminans FFH2055]MEB4630834.1 triphosphoribosyl-dephospho-CoA synthase MdcB [Burkholderia contaminans]MEB4639203.1 triphosphoribosyl-dephospho-CoA synthase MdcB [Burkholderia contaminans]MEB4653859.1 triphosphoribosyl-dephospho-CoA synthase MdcB [Burkholderia contaminans]MEB4658438.1 triphosphoribosyl-dephospho-CoA synthase MdcB [Burkholderia contamina
MSAWTACRVPALSDAERIAELAERSLVLEIETYPKPGLVSHVDTGSHTDMDAATFARSAAVLRPYFAELADAGARDADMAVLRKIGLRAEHAMLAATGGVNTHRGAIFGLGLLCAAAGRRAIPGTMPAGVTLGAFVSRRWGADILGGPRLPDSHGERASRRYGVGGARREAADGFTTVYAVGLPALRRAQRDLPSDREAARVDACFALIAALDDTNLLHRGGQAGLDFARATARAFVARGGVRARDWRLRAAAAHRAFVARRLSPGGAADLLAMSVFVDALDVDEGVR